MMRHMTSPSLARCGLFITGAGLSVVLSLIPSVHAQAAEYLTAIAGGTGGNPFYHRCSPDEVMVGVVGKASAFVDSIGPLCVQVDPLGRWTSNADPEGSAGGTGGSQFSIRCPENQAVSGIQGRASALIDRLQIRCGPLTAGPRLASSGTILGSHAGGTGGTVFGPFDCVDNKPSRGLIGRAGIYVDQLRLACDYPPSPVRSVAARMLVGNLRTAIIRTQRDPLMEIVLSSKPRGTVHVPVKNNNPTIAEMIEHNEIQAYDNPWRVEVIVKGAGCASFEVGFPGQVAPPVNVLVDSRPAPQLALSLSILEWTTSTTSAFGTLTIPAAAPSSGVAVRLASSHQTEALIPPSVTIPPGSRSTTFEIRRPVTGTLGGCIIVTATGNGATVQSPMLFHSTMGKLRPGSSGLKR